MSYKLIICDCDHTLIDEKAYLPKENIRVIRKLMADGIKFAIATGRNDSLVFEYAKEIGGDINVIGCNGATIRNPLTGKIYRNEHIPTESLRALTNLLDSMGIGYKAYSMDKGFENNLDLDKKIRALTGRMYENTIELDSYTIKTGSEIWTEDILKVVAIERMDILDRIRNNASHIKGINAVLSGKFILDFISEKATKGNAALELMEILGVAPEETIAFGDSENDISMLESAGLSICMKNGDERVKPHCHKITELDNNNAGVADTLKKIFNIT